MPEDMRWRWKRGSHFSGLVLAAAMVVEGWHGGVVRREGCGLRLKFKFELALLFASPKYNAI